LKAKKFDSIVYHRTKFMPSNLQKERLRKLRRMSIFQVDTISATLELEGNTIECRGDTLLEDRKRMCLLFSRSCRYLMMHESLCKELALYLRVESSELLSIVSRSVNDVKVMFANRGIATTIKARTTSEQLLYEGRLMLSDSGRYIYILLLLLYVFSFFLLTFFLLRP